MEACGLVHASLCDVSRTPLGVFGPVGLFGTVGA